jgi:hypothetical protein
MHLPMVLDEKDDTIGLIEANILIGADADLLRRLNDWFEREIWSQARTICTQDFEKATERWRARQAIRKLPKYRTLLDALRQQPASLANRSLLVWIYKSKGLSEAVKIGRQRARNELHDGDVDCWENTEAPPGSYVIDFHLQRRRQKATCNGIWRVLSDNPLRKIGPSSMLLCRRVRNFEGMPLGDRAAWEAAAAAAAETGKDSWPIEDFAPFVK